LPKAGPIDDNGMMLMNKNASTLARYLLGTNSATTNVKVNCTAPARPTRTVPPITAGIFLAVAQMRAPMNPRVWPPIKKYRRPKISPSLPTKVKPTPAVSVKAVEIRR
jgi:hypothetical protein